jgi:hypothetical protein
MKIPPFDVATSEVFTAVVFWVAIAPYSVVAGFKRFGWPCCLYLQVRSAWWTPSGHTYRPGMKKGRGKVDEVHSNPWIISCTLLSPFTQWSSRVALFVGQLSPEIGQRARVVGLPKAARRQVQVTWLMTRCGRQTWTWSALEARTAPHGASPLAQQLVCLHFGMHTIF